jgi:hypothetical protein
MTGPGFETRWRPVSCQLRSSHKEITARHHDKCAVAKLEGRDSAPPLTLLVLAAACQTPAASPLHLPGDGPWTQTCTCPARQAPAAPRDR